MFRKIIVGVDGREPGSDAVALGQELAGADAEIVLLHAFPYDARPGRELLGHYEDRMRAEALSVLHEEAEDARFELHAVPDVSPARALQHEAEAEGADLIVVGSCHRGVVGRVLLGDVSRAVMHGAPCPVAVAPRGYRRQGRPIRVIGVGMDDSDEARAAAELAAGIASERDGDLRLLSAISLPAKLAASYAVVFDWPQLLEEHRNAAKAMLSTTIERLNLPATTDVVEGLADAELEKLSHAVDVLVLGSRGWGAVKRVVLGSTSDRVTHHASCPVIVVPGPVSQGNAKNGEDRSAST